MKKFFWLIILSPALLLWPSTDNYPEAKSLYQKFGGKTLHQKSRHHQSKPIVHYRHLPIDYYQHRPLAGSFHYHFRNPNWPHFRYKRHRYFRYVDPYPLLRNGRYYSGHRCWDSHEGSYRIYYDYRHDDISPYANIQYIKPAGNLVIIPTPVDAQVWVDGYLLSPNTNHQYGLGLLAGQHSVTIIKTGYQTYQQTIEILAGSCLPLEITLIRK